MHKSIRNPIRFVHYTSTLILMSFVGCAQLSDNNQIGLTDIRPPASTEVQTAAFSPEEWTALAPGFKYREHRTGVAFRVTPSELTAEGLLRVAAHVRTLESSVTSEIEAFRLTKWQEKLEQARTYHRDWQHYWPLLEKQVRQGQELGVLREGASPSLQLASCSLGASAMPTSGSLGAKAYATAYCSPGGAVDGNVRTETSARAGTSWPAPCRDDGWSSSQCMSSAFGSAGCDSAALAEYYFRYSDLTIIADQESDTNGSCA